MRVSQPKVRHVVLWGIILFDKTLERRVAVATSFFASGWKMTPLCKKRICLVRLWQTIGKGKILWSGERKPKTWGRLPPRWEKVDKPAHLSFSCSLDLLLNQTNMRYRIRQFALSLEKVMLDITSSIFIVCFQITLEIKVEYCSTMSWTHIFASWHFFHSLRVAWHHLNFRPAFVRWADIKCWLHQEKTRQDKTKP